MLHCEGKTVVGNYHGTTVTGKIESYRLAYGGRIRYTVCLDNPIQLPWRSELTDTVILNASDIQKVQN